MKFFILFSTTVILFSSVNLAYSQKKKALDYPEKGTLILTGGAFTKDGINSFVQAAGGVNADLIFIPSASSGIKLPSGYIWEPKDSTKEEIDSFETELAKLFGVIRIKVLHTTSRTIANTKEFCEPIKKTDGVWLGPGNAGRYINIFLDTRFQKELEALLSRGGIIGGNSAGSIIQGSYVVRGKPDKPVLMAKDKERGFGFLKNFVINPHLVSAKRELELINVLEWHPELIGIAADDETTLIVKNGIIETMGSGPVYIYDNIQHGKNWWYEMTVGKKFSLKERKVVD